MVRFGTVSKVYLVTMPKFGPPPFRAKNRSEFSCALAVTIDEFARTTCII